MNLNPDYKKAEIDLILDGIKRTPAERFNFLTLLIKIQKLVQQEKGPNVSFNTTGDALSQILNFWRLLQFKQVKYILSGDFAMCFHGHNLSTGVMSLWVEDTFQNRLFLREIFKECRIGEHKIEEQMEFIPELTSFKFSNGVSLKIIFNMKGLEGFTFDECLQLASKADIDGVQVPFLHINHLIANKVAVNRPKDQVDVIYLEKIKKLLEDSDSSMKDR